MSPPHALRLRILHAFVIVSVFSNEFVWAQVQLRVYPQVQQIAAPNGLEFKAEPRLNARTTQKIEEGTNFRGKAYLDTPEGRFFLSEKSFENLQRGQAAYWAYIFGVSSRAGGVPSPVVPSHAENRSDDLPDSSMEKEWDYSFQKENEGEVRASRFSGTEGRRLLLANGEWIVTGSFVSLGLGRGRCELVFYDSRTLMEEMRASVPNDVLHMDWNEKRGQFLAVTTCGSEETRWIKYPDHCAQALVLIDPRTRKIEATPLWRDSGNSDFDWDGSCSPFWNGNEIGVPYDESNRSTLPSNQVRFRTTEFAKVGVTFFKRAASENQKLLSCLRPEQAGLAFEGISISKEFLPYHDDPSLRLQGSANAVTTGGQAGIHLVRPLAARGILDLNLSSLKARFHRVEDRLVGEAGIFSDGVLRYLTPSALGLVSAGHVTALEGLNPGDDKTQKLGFSHDVAYHASLSKDGKVQIKRVDSGGMVHEERVALPEGIVSREWVDFSLNASRKSIAVMQGDFIEGRFWKEYSWEKGSLIGRPFEDGTGKGFPSDGVLMGSTPDGMSLVSGVTDHSTDGVSYSVFLLDSGMNRTLDIGSGPQRGEAPLVAERDGSDGARVLSSGWMSAQLEHVNLRTGQVAKLASWSWDASDGNAFFERSSKWLFVPQKDGYGLFQPFGKEASRKVANLRFDYDGYAIVLPNGMYAGSPGCERMLNGSAPSKRVEAAVLAPWRNRPAEVLKALNGDPVQVRLLEQVTQRWLRRSGFDEEVAEPSVAALPVARVVQRPALWESSADLILPIEVQIGDEPLREIMVRTNGALAAKISGVALGSAQSDSTTTVPAKIKLAHGRNWIEVVAVDAKGRSGGTDRFRVILNPPVVESKRYVVALGVSKYAREELNLDYAAKDATEMAELLSGLVPSSEALLLTDAGADSKTLNQIASFLADSTENDEVILFCAGHGVLDADLDYVFAAHDFDPANPGKTGIRLDDLVSVVANAPARNRLILLDTCQAGLVGEAEEAILAHTGGSPIPGVRSIPLGGMASAEVRPAIAGAARFVEELYSLPGLIRGVNIIGASGGAQYAYEMEQLSNGVFTAAVIEALRPKRADANKDGRVTVSELRDYLFRRVPELTGNAQRPSVVAFERDQDFELIRK